MDLKSPSTQQAQVEQTGQRFDRDRYQAYYNEGYKPGHLLNYAGDKQDDDDGRNEILLEQTSAWLKLTGISANPKAQVLELGCALGQLHSVHPGWVGLEFSETAVSRIRENYGNGVCVVQGDMQELPFPDDSIDAIFSWAAIEHVPRPDRVMAEVSRTLKPGGVAILGPAWNCRAWTVKRLDVRPYRDLNPRLKLEKFTIPLRNHLAWRALQSIPGRISREIHAVLKGPTQFDFISLFPDFSLNLPHISDDDALACMDPHAAIMFFRSRGWEISSHPGLVRRITARHEPIVVRKPRF
jgi:SAM-dependent methyltransferase